MEHRKARILWKWNTVSENSVKIEHRKAKMENTILRCDHNNVIREREYMEAWIEHAE